MERIISELFVHEMQNLRIFRRGALLGGTSPEPVQARKDRIKWYLENRYLKELDRIDGEPMDFEWKNFTGFTTAAILKDHLHVHVQ